MKEVYFIRHAKSSWKNTADLLDIERPLNARGLRDAPEMAARLVELEVHPELLLVSPAVRTLTTASIFAEAWNYPQTDFEIQAELYEALPSDVLGLLQRIDDQHTCVAVFGHNPSLTQLANLFSGAYIENVPTCGVIGVRLDVHRWADLTPDAGTLLCFEYPKKQKI